MYNRKDMSGEKYLVPEDVVQEFDSFHKVIEDYNGESADDFCCLVREFDDKFMRYWVE